MPNPDLILHNGNIYPRPETERAVQAIAVWNGQVTAVGSDDEVVGLKGRSVKLIDLHKKTVIPGLTDSHIHLLGYAMLLRTLDLSECRSIADIQRAVKDAALKRRQGWILGRGWDQERLREHRYPTREDFQTVQQPIFLRRICGHIAIANSSALSNANITKTTSDPKDGLIERDVSGEPTGVLKEGALGMVQDVIPWSEQEVEKTITVASKRLIKVGLTSLHCIIENSLELKVLRRLKNLGKIAQSIYAIIPLGLLDRAIGTGLLTEPGRPGFRIGGVKMFLDGSLGAKTAALTEPYSDEGSNNGILTLGGERLQEAAERAVASGFQLSMHAIGDRAVEEALAVVEKVGTKYRGRDLRHRIEHASLTPPRLLPLFRRKGIIASIQPSFITSDTWAEKRLGPRRVRYLYPFQSFIKAGIHLTAGSDCPVENPNPLRGVWSAVRRPGLSQDERLSVGQSLGCYTSGPAYASFSEKYQGALEPGMLADMLVLDSDPFTCPFGQLAGVKVLQTFVEGSPLLPQS